AGLLEHGQQLCLQWWRAALQHFGSHLPLKAAQLCEDFLASRVQVQASHALVVLAGAALYPSPFFKMSQGAGHKGFVGMAVLDKLALRDTWLFAHAHEYAQFIKSQVRMQGFHSLAHACAKEMYQLMHGVKHIDGQEW